jgi:hypothetical protein
MTKDELLEWKDMYTFNVKHTEVLAKMTGNRKAQYEKRTRGVLNNILLWAITLDYR